MWRNSLTLIFFAYAKFAWRTNIDIENVRGAGQAHIKKIRPPLFALLTSHSKCGRTIMNFRVLMQRIRLAHH